MRSMNKYGVILVGGTIGSVFAGGNCSISDLEKVQSAISNAASQIDFTKVKICKDGINAHSKVHYGNKTKPNKKNPSKESDFSYDSIFELTEELKGWIGTICSELPKCKYNLKAFKISDEVIRSWGDQFQHRVDFDWQDKMKKNITCEFCLSFDKDIFLKDLTRIDSLKNLIKNPVLNGQTIVNIIRKLLDSVNGLYLYFDDIYNDENNNDLKNKRLQVGVESLLFSHQFSGSKKNSNVNDKNEIILQAINLLSAIAGDRISKLCSDVIELLKNNKTKNLIQLANEILENNVLETEPIIKNGVKLIILYGMNNIRFSIYKV